MRAQAPEFRLYDNHTLNNVVFPFVYVDSATKLPPEIWDAVRRVRNVALETLVDLGNRDFCYIFTNQLFHDDAEDQELYELMEETARRMQACFLPVCLDCAEHIHKERIAVPEREAHFKMTRVSFVDEVSECAILRPEHSNRLDLDVTRLSPAQAAERILAHAHSVTQS